MMKRCGLVFIWAALLLSTPAWAAGGLQPAVEAAMQELGVASGDERLGVLTNAAYVAPVWVDRLQALTGCSIGRGNLLFYHCPLGRPLKVALMRRDTRAAVVLSMPADGLPRRVALDIGPERTADKAAWQEIQARLGAETMAVVGILNAWADGAPFDFLKCAEFHNHSCGGITSGYLMARYIQQRWPLAEGQAYLYIASPVWCKEDALQSLLDLTAGKHSLVTKPLGRDTRLPFTQAAGIVVVRQGRRGAGVAHVLTFDWHKARQGLKKSGGIKPNPLSWDDPPAKYVGAAFECELSAPQIERMVQAANPYEVLPITSGRPEKQ